MYRVRIFSCQGTLGRLGRASVALLGYISTSCRQAARLAFWPAADEIIGGRCFPRRLPHTSPQFSTGEGHSGRVRGCSSKWSHSATQLGNRSGLPTTRESCKAVSIRRSYVADMNAKREMFSSPSRLHRVRCGQGATCHPWRAQVIVTMWPTRLREHVGYRPSDCPIIVAISTRLLTGRQRLKRCCLKRVL